MTHSCHRYYANDEDRMAGEEKCHFVGHLANEKEACVAVTGCAGSEPLEFTIMSKVILDSNAILS